MHAIHCLLIKMTITCGHGVRHVLGESVGDTTALSADGLSTHGVARSSISYNITRFIIE